MFTCKNCKKEFNNALDYRRHFTKWCPEHLCQLMTIAATARAWQDRAGEVLISGDQLSITILLRDIRDADLGENDG